MNFKETIDDEINLDYINSNFDDALSLGEICIEDELYIAEQISTMLNDYLEMISSNTNNISEISSKLDISVDNLTDFINSEINNLSTKHKNDILQLTTYVQTIYNDLSDDISNYHNLKNELNNIYKDIKDDISNISDLSVELKGDISDLSNELKGDISKLSGDLSTVISDLSVELKLDISDLSSELKGDISDLSNELKGDISKLSGELKLDISDLSSELKGDISKLSGELKLDISDLSSELKGDISDLSNDLSVINAELNYLESNPTITKPNITLNVKPTKITELTESLSIDISFDKGNYSFGPDTDISVISYKLKINDKDTTLSNFISNYVILNLDSYQDILTYGENKISVEAKYSKGSIPKTNLGNEIISAQISASEVSNICKFDKNTIVYIKYNSSENITDIKEINNISDLSANLSCLDSEVAFNLETENMQQIIIAINKQSKIKSVSIKNLYNGFPQNIKIYDSLIESYTLYEVLNSKADINKNIYEINFKQN